MDENGMCHIQFQMGRFKSHINSCIHGVTHKEHFKFVSVILIKQFRAGNPQAINLQSSKLLIYAVK
jgi:hypothetical protein